MTSPEKPQMCPNLGAFLLAKLIQKRLDFNK